MGRFRIPAGAPAAGVAARGGRRLATADGLVAAVKDKLSAAAIAGVRDPAVAKQFTDRGMEIVGDTPAECAGFRAREYRAGRT